MKDSMGDRMKDYEDRFRHMLPRRAYTMIRLDGKAFHSYTRNLERPFDQDFRHAMQVAAVNVCRNAQGCKLGYVQSDEISLVLTDFDGIGTSAWFDGNMQKIVSVAASLASVAFNTARLQQTGVASTEVFDGRCWSLADPWEVYNSFLWRQKDCTRNAVQMVARSVASHKECHNKNLSQLQELIHEKGLNFNDFPVDCKRGAFLYPGENGWVVDVNSPILSQEQAYFFSKVPLIEQFKRVEKINEDN